MVSKASILSSRSERYDSSRTTSVQFQEPVDYMPVYWQKMVTHHIVLMETGDQCDLRELKKRNFIGCPFTVCLRALLLFSSSIDVDATQPEVIHNTIVMDACVVAPSERMEARHLICSPI